MAFTHSGLGATRVPWLNIKVAPVITYFVIPKVRELDVRDFLIFGFDSFNYFAINS